MPGGCGTSTDRSLILGALLGFTFLGSVGLDSAKAATITLSPSSTSIDIGGTVTVDVNISGLAAGAAPSLSAFDLEMTFDESIAGWTAIVFGDPGGDQLDLTFAGTITSYDDFLPGSLFFSEVSFDDQATLDNYQLDDFRLAQLTFEGLSEGTMVFNLPTVTLLDAMGDSILLDATVTPVSISVAAVPLPAAVWLLGSVLGGLALFRRRSSLRPTA